MNDRLDLAGIGIGPFNLSLAALLSKVPHCRARFFERRNSFNWHPGMMLPGTQMQTSYLKDLVTPIDPSNSYGFLSYLVKKGRFYRFINAEYPRVRRIEFADYLRWAAEQLPSLSFGTAVDSVAFDTHGFDLRGEGVANVHSRHLVVATGMKLNIPAWVERYVGDNCLHSHHYVGSEFSVAGKRVAIIGGGQSGAEIFLDLMAGNRGRAEKIVWLSRRQNLDPLDETAFINEYFTPHYVRNFHRLPEARKPPIVSSHKLTGDGVSPATLQALSQYLYDSDFLDCDTTPYAILPNREVHLMSGGKNAFHLYMRNGFNHTDESVVVDKIILATGYRYQLPECLMPLRGRLDLDADGLPRLTEDYRVPWDGPAEHRIYMQNAGRNSHGVADAQLSLAAWRSAIIINSLMEEAIYDVDPCPSPLQWGEDYPAKTQTGSENQDTATLLRVGRV
ncbi:lysine N(6)-hydroxylase/L-ornithine N(5)-oxygenase family protein [Methylomicrobium agile]|uniref:lysine N(6)-hydroxylase/L-ornithine N(5)-oxygenase family protein n=1 Tax=Methylomicrobium agile TaxID=39774 RepID=UPI0005644DE0|nr:SidA/IucD/PvdA family monooxygenase [Methylomicrobium agile]